MDFKVIFYSWESEQMKDMVVEQVRKARAELFAKANHDLATLVKQLQKRQSTSKRKLLKPPQRPQMA